MHLYYRVQQESMTSSHACRSARQGTVCSNAGRPRHAEHHTPGDSEPQLEGRTEICRADRSALFLIRTYSISCSGRTGVKCQRSSLGQMENACVLISSSSSYWEKLHSSTLSLMPPFKNSSGQAWLNHKSLHSISSTDVRNRKLHSCKEADKQQQHLVRLCTSACRGDHWYPAFKADKAGLQHA